VLHLEGQTRNTVFTRMQDNFSLRRPPKIKQVCQMENAFIQI